MQISASDSAAQEALRDAAEAKVPLPFKEPQRLHAPSASSQARGGGGGARDA